MARISEKITALYERLSRDDLVIGESVSIQNQKVILEKYAAENGFSNIRHFSDDGTSGTVFNRPGLNALLDEVKAGNVAVVIFKDQSRIGRDVLEVGLLKRTFEENDVRYIAANDGLDSAKGFDIMSIFRDVFNEYYVAEASKKVRASKHSCALQGKVVSRASFGYLVTEDKAVWVIDETAAEIVREVFKRVIEGDTSHTIAIDFNNRGVMPPNEYYMTLKDNPPSKKGYWTGRTVFHIIENQTYIGRYIAGKYTTPSYKNHKRITRPEDEWVVIENHHPAIVDLETFEAAQRLRSARRRLTKRGDKGALSGLLFCSDCNSKLAMAHQDYDYYICSQYRSKQPWYDYVCTRHGIRREAIEEIALAKIRETVAFAIKNRKQFAEQVNKMANKDTEKAIKTKTAEMLKAVLELDKIISRIYEDHVAGKLTEERFNKMLTGYETEQATLSAAAEALTAEVEDLKSKTANLQSFMNLVDQYGEITELTAEIARTFIEKIIVHEGVFENANRRSARTQEVHIFLSYIGEFNI